MIKKNKVFVISGPSGVGKGTLVERVLKRVPRISRSVSVTTRRPRHGEKASYHYHFISDEEFRNRRKSGEFLEWAEVHGNLYGTLEQTVNHMISEGQDVVLVIDVQGGLSVREKIPGSVLIFVMPPSFGELRKRLAKRGTESADIVERRTKRAKEELEHISDFDYSVVNDDLDVATEQLISIIEKERKRTDKA